ncbi:MAG: hypothetical protein IT314_05180 [Anaerolineales bacterium]|nr:hypothetical protein [Anaerolineales bacterium]
MSSKNQMPTDPNEISPMTRGLKLNLESKTLKPAATMNGKKNNPTKSLNLPVSQDGLMILKTWSLSNSNTMLAMESGCPKHRRLFSKASFCVFIVASFSANYATTWLSN